MEKMTNTVPPGAKEVAGKFAKGSVVVPLIGHMAGQKGKPATVLRAVQGTFYIVDFHDGNGPHKYYAEGELKQGESTGGLHAALASHMKM